MTYDDDGVIRVLADRFERFERDMRDQLVGMRADFKDALVEFRAALRVVTDAESGYVPRSEIATKFAAQEQMDDRIAERVDALQRWIVGTGLAVLTLAAAVFGAAHR